MANGLVAVGPLDPVHGFPLWYEDSDGVRLELGLGPDDPNLPALELPTPGAPVSFPDNFPDEAFYFLAEAEMLVGGPAGTARARLILALEAAFGGTGAVLAGQQMVFGRVRLRVDDLEPGSTYTATHPYGVLSGVADDRGRVFETEDIGAPGGFTSAFASSIGPFLTWAANAPVGYLGDGTAERPVTVGAGGPAGSFRLEGPGVGIGGPRDPADPTNPNKAFTALFTVQGKRATRFGVAVPRAVFTTADQTVDVFATSVPDQSLLASGPGVPITALRADGGRYIARIAAAARPATLTVTNTTDRPASVVTAAVTDAVTITDATYDLAGEKLTVAATSSAGGTLTVVELGAPPGAIATPAPPAEVTVVSVLGGRATHAVAVTGAAFGPAPVVADAGVDRDVEEGATATLDGTGSVGAAGFAWQQTAGPTVALSGGTTATATFTAPSAGSVLTFRLTVTGQGGPTSDTVRSTVTPVVVPTPDAITPDRVEFRTGRSQWRIDGTVTGPLPDRVTARLRTGGPEIGSAAADATNAFDLRRDLGPGDAALRPAAGDVVEVTSSRGATRTVAVTIRS